MGLSHFPHGVSSFGMPVLGGGVAGGNVFFVSSTGNNANGGTDPEDAVATVTKALTLCTANKGDTIVVLPGTIAENIVVNKAMVRIIGYSNGLGGPYMSRINPASATSSTATILVQARDVEIAGLQVAGNHDAGYNTPAIFLDGDNSGTRCYIHNCTIENLTPTATAYSTGIKLVGDRHTIENCLIDSCDVGIDVTSGTVTTYETIIKDNILRANNIGIYLRSEQAATGQAADVTIRNYINAQGAYAQTSGITATAAYAGIIADNRITGYTTAIGTATTLSDNFDGTAGGTLIT